MKKNDLITIKFEGGLADDHRLPAYEAGQTLAGVARSLMIPLAYLESGKVRYRNVSTEHFKLNLVAQRPGSFETVYELLTTPDALAVIGATAFAVDVAKDVTKDFVKDFVYSIFKRCIGQSASKDVEELEADRKLSSGDLDALVDAIEPAVKRAHATIGNGASNVTIIHGNNNVVRLNSGTKAYVNATRLDTKLRQKAFSVGVFNANTSNGRVFDYDLGRTVPFTNESSVDIHTITALTQSLAKYARSRKLGDDNAQASRVLIVYQAVLGPNDELKKILVHEARAIKE